MNPTDSTTFLAQAVPAAALLPIKATAVRIATPVDIRVSFGTAAAALAAAGLLLLAGTAGAVKVPEGSTHVAVSLAALGTPPWDRTVHLTAADAAA